MPKTRDSSTKSRTKPAKPYPDFPLFPHATYRWAKKIRGKLHYFGPWEDAEGALQRYEQQRDALYAGRTPRAPGDGLTVRGLCNHFLTAKQRKLDAGEMKPKTWGDYYAVCEHLIAIFGKDRLVDDLAADDFGELRASFAEGRGVHGLANLVRRTRSVFKYGYEAGLLEKPIRYGPEFVQPGPRELRKARAAGGVRTFTPGEIRALLGEASVPMKAMVLLGVNCGFGNTDCSELPQAVVDLKASVIVFPRPKTGISRRCPLWPETVKALRAAIEQRPEARDEADEGLVFLTRYGKRWVRHENKPDRKAGVSVNSVALEFTKLAKAAGVKRGGRGFYQLRHTFRTVADNVPDEPAIKLIMGHEAFTDMSTHYRHGIADARLKAVTDHVHAWLFGAAVKPKKKAGKKSTRKKKASTKRG